MGAGAMTGPRATATAATTPQACARELWGEGLRDADLIAALRGRCPELSDEGAELTIREACGDLLDLELAEAEAPAALRFITTRELHAQTPPEPEWVWRGYLARRAITLVAGRPKAGKSTLIAAAVEAITSEAGTFLGRALTGCPAVVLSEEGHATIADKLPASDRILIANRETSWPLPAWTEGVRQATGAAQAAGAGLLVIDTFGFWAALGRDAGNDAGAVADAMRPLTIAARAGLAVLLVHHTRKAEAEHGEAVLGSTQFAAAVDAILEVERVDKAPTQRQLLAVGRWGATPGALVYDRDPATRALGMVGEAADRGEARALAQRRAILASLPLGEPGATLEDLEADHGDRRDWRPALDALVRAGQVRQTGSGRKGSPYRFHVLSDSVENDAHGNHTETTETTPRTSSVSGVSLWDTRNDGAGVTRAHCGPTETPTETEPQILGPFDPWAEAARDPRPPRAREAALRGPEAP